jgi:hypothetical protein
VPRIAYVSKAFSPGSLAIIEQANAICAEYAAQGFDLTLRQLYYQFVARDFIPNLQTEYKRLGGIINDARLAGRLDWDYIVDRTRNLRALAHWDDPESILDAVARQYRQERWADQPYRLEVWIEKDALVGVIAGVADRNDVPYFSCRGYTSQSELWGAARRLREYERDGQKVVVIHLGDHDPSGIDMTRDIQDRLRLFRCQAQVERIALNMDQVEQYQPPPNPAKLTDSRAGDYVERFHDPDIDEPGEARCWELDALDPATLDGLIQGEIDRWRNDNAWEASTREQEHQRGLLVAVHERWDEVTALVDGDQDDGDQG